MPLPLLEIDNLQESVPLDLDRLRDLVETALPLCLEQPGSDHPIEIENAVACSIVDDAAMAAVHAQFLGDPTTTDVITFPYGEIIVCADVARREADARNLPLEHELSLYLIHGLLHLNGYNDKSPEAAARMHSRQTHILKLLPE